MNKEKLIEELKILGVHSRNYTIDEFPYRDSSWVLEPSFKYNGLKKQQVWNVFNFERGKRYDEVTFSSESEACLLIYKKLKTWQELTNK